MFFFLRFKYGPLIIVLAGVALMATAAGVTHHLATGITGAVLVVTGAAVWVTRKRRGTPAGDPDQAPRAVSRSTYSAGHPHGRAETDAEADPTSPSRSR
jgi:drug/metabolite transporter (DMT)-like permease